MTLPGGSPTRRTISPGGLHDTLPVKMTDETFDEVTSGNLLYEGEITLPPGKYNLKVVARENEGGKIGTFETSARLAGCLRSRVELEHGGVLERSAARRSTPAHAIRSRPQRAAPGGESHRAAQCDPRVSHQPDPFGLPGIVCREASGDALRRAPRAAPPPSVAFVFLRHGRKFAEAGPFNAKAEKGSAPKTTYFAQIPLEKFPVGRYTVQVNVLDPAAARVAFTRLPMAVVKPPPRTPHGGVDMLSWRLARC